MKRNVPHQELFNEAKVFDKWQTIVLIVATLLAVISILLTSLQKKYSAPPLDTYIDLVNGLASVLSVSYIAFELIGKYKLFKAEKARRIDLIDHSFDTRFAGEKSTGYYNSGGINTGIYKLAVHGFENSLFTCNSAKKMTKKRWSYATVVFAVFFISASVGDKQWVINLLQIAAGGILVQQAIILQTFSNRIETIHSDFKALFNNLTNVTDKSKHEGEMMKNVLNYETTLAWSALIMDDKIFFRDNDKLSAKWEQMKRDYNI